jgi:hypothetical protein
MSKFARGPRLGLAFCRFTDRVRLAISTKLSE